MSRSSIKLEQDGSVSLIHMTSRFGGIPLFKVFAFYVDGLLIDTGFTRCKEDFLKACDGLPTLNTVVNTHYHEDHTGNNFWVTQKYGILPLSNSRTAFYTKSPSSWIRPYRRFVWGTPPSWETGKVDSEVRTKNYKFSVIHTPGHSDDHICLYEPNEGWLFSGDLFLDEEVRYTREDEDIDALLDSLKRVAALASRKMFCSFSGVIENPREAIEKKIDFSENLRQKVEEGLREGLSPQEIQKRLLGSGDRLRFITGGQISKKNTIQAFIKKFQSLQTDNRGHGRIGR